MESAWPRTPLEVDSIAPQAGRQDPGVIVGDPCNGAGLREQIAQAFAGRGKGQAADEELVGHLAPPGQVSRG